MRERFPILDPVGRIRDVPWKSVEPYREQAMKNHNQTLEELASRGGLTWEELFAVMAGLSWRQLEEAQRK